MDKNRDDGMNDAKVRSFADSTGMLLISRVGMAFGVPLIASLMVWVLSSVNTMEIDIGVMKSQIQSGVEDRYHGADASKDFALRDSQIQRNSQDIARLTRSQESLTERVDALTGRPSSKRDPFP